MLNLNIINSINDIDNMPMSEDVMREIINAPSELTLNDILIGSHLWGMYIFPEFQFSPKIHNYLQSIKLKCHFEYHSDYWK